MNRTNRLAFSFSPMRDASPRDIVTWARRAEELGYEAVFIPESFNDSLAYAQAVAQATTRLKVGTAIANVYLRHPTLLAQQAAAVQEFSHGRLLLGLGVGHRAVNASLGIEMGDTYAKMRDTIAVCRNAWVKGGHQPRPATPPRILAAALQPRMIALAGEIADGVIYNLFPLERYPRAMNALREGASAAGRSVDALDVCHFTTAYLGPDRGACLHEAKRMLSRYANLQFYGNMLAQSGFADEVAAVRAAWKRKDVAAAEAAVSNAMASATTLVGDPDACHERIRAYQMAGAAMVIVFPNPVGEPRAAAVERALAAFAPR
jgi:alkanesulfonate monooxygenase SsuD/methylene tetrahydromethanopterin reductase-like flavin-dependent oxidoreductase (luciferase family)